MPTGGNRHRLILYTYLLDRWWQAIMLIGVFLLILAGGLGILPIYLPQYPFMWVSDWKLWVLTGAGVMALLLAFVMIAVRKSAYIQPFDNHLRLVTPFLRLNISYSRIRQTYSSEMEHIYPANKVRGWKRNILRPLASKTAIVLELSAFPIPRLALYFFLSPFFFPDKSSRLALLVSDWIAFSTEMESLRSSWQDTLRTRPEHPRTSVFNGNYQDRSTR
ncbi:MAG: hypothetical protein ABIJ39_02895 [Chloroflexota bacterium]